MVNGEGSLPVHKVLLYYALKRLGLDTDPTACRPQDQQIVLLNRSTISRIGLLPPSWPDHW